MKTKMTADINDVLCNEMLVVKEWVEWLLLSDQFLQKKQNKNEIPLNNIVSNSLYVDDIYANIFRMSR